MVEVIVMTVEVVRAVGISSNSEDSGSSNSEDSGSSKSSRW